MSKKTLIIGGGLSGLALANRLSALGHDYMLIDARSRFGGRIKTEHVDGAMFDMGPAWFWPGQPRIAALIQELGLAQFDQFTDGAQLFEDRQGQVQRNRGFAAMQGSWRLRNGLTALTDALAARLPDSRKMTGAQVTKIIQDGGNFTANFRNGDEVKADRIVLALPPRIAANIDYSPALPTTTMQAMQSIPTWMAGQAKAVAVYDTPFWRDAGLSGDASSQHGPMVEIHDASPDGTGPFALFGFIGVPPHGRLDTAVLRQHIKAQLIRLFGPQAANPKQLFIKDWACDANTATEADHQPLYAHPTYGKPKAMMGLMDGQLFFAGSETAPQFGGYLEGALEAVDILLSDPNFNA